MKKFNGSESGVFDAYKPPSHALEIAIGIAWIIGFVILLWVLLEWNYKR